ncbi:Hypothetical protein GcM3_191024 [Golovinomyces cichoracearum]|uniref:Uncharacterized protein n=1 Tax=Golovinomyces cichoracearum TaxID=62708 RepID=A0A420HHN3_9PEZI|nr:Hypothetical protein GcM3_191024 [Golovinomyces cichoracearum]
MSSHLHPRSRLTSSLFATTLFASIFVVVLPHILPCPAPRRVAFSDDGGSGSRIQVPSTNPMRQNNPVNSERQGSPTDIMKDGTQNLYTKQNPSHRECPIPKPRGFFGDLLGFKSSVTVGRSDNGDKSSESYKNENIIKPP